MMQKHIRKNFRYPEIAQEMGVQGRVSVIFVIQKDGSIGDIRMRGPDKNLEAEAMRIIKKLPRVLFFTEPTADFIHMFIGWQR